MSRQLLTNVNKSATPSMMVLPAKYFSSYAKDLNTSGQTEPSKASDPASRFQKRNKFMKRRHLERDHIIRTQHYDIRIAAIRATETLKDAVRRHGMVAEEARAWGGFAANSALYSSFLRGDERVRTELFAKQELPESDQGSDVVLPGDLENRLFIESFAVGEIRGHATFNQLRLLKHRMLFPATPEESDNQTTLVPGEGVMRVSRVLYSQSTPYMTSVHSQGSAQHDWSTLFRQSEQIPTRVLTQCDVADTPLDKVLGVDANGTVTKAMTPEEIVAEQSGSAADPAAAAAAVPGTTASDHSAETALDADKLAQDPLLYLHVPVEDAQFSGAVVIQVLAGAPDPVVAQEVLAARDRRKAKEAKAKDVKGAVTGVADPEADGSATNAETEASNDVDGEDVEETDEQYVKRVQLERLQARAASLDMREIMTHHGVAAYVACLLGEDLEGLGQRTTDGKIASEGNVNGEFDFEAMERFLIDSGVRDKALKQRSEAAAAAAASSDIVSDVIAGAGGVATPEQYKYHFQYRPVAFFCRCYQTKVEHKLAQMPVDLLESLHEDGGAAFTCDYCNAKQEVTVALLDQAIQEKQKK